MKILYKSEPCDGIFIIMRKDGKWNYMNTKGNLLSPNMWFSTACPFFDGFAKVQNQRRKWNIINMQGEFICPKWLAWIGEFNKGFGSPANDPRKHRASDFGSTRPRWLYSAHGGARTSHAGDCPVFHQGARPRTNRRNAFRR